MKPAIAHFCFIGLLLFMYTNTVWAQGMIVQQGTFMRSKDNVALTCIKCNITGNGNVNLSSATILLQGGNNVHVGTANGFVIKKKT